ncbi:carbamoyltransferase HypF [Kosmotoga olearia]|uniref:carbamoyltransferase HypF n=1 Tax=Kosmotoga olearia TaxID=651457 RepID=UPI0006749F69|nr:carbamoyltransferase HypF [Kosmotoga olearia]
MFEIMINGIVQGVGFRPFVATLAEDLGLHGYVENCESGVRIVLDCDETKLREFIEILNERKPMPAKIRELSFSKKAVKTNKIRGFRIINSKKTGKINTSIPPDIAMCDKCIGEMFSKGNRRYLYPFTNCARCGPRFSIAYVLPYDRDKTSMDDFSMCHDCNTEYTNLRDWRYHAQTNCCEDCGPKYWIVEIIKNEIVSHFSGEEAVKQAIGIIRAGGTVAIKGIGGIHLVCKPDPDAIKKLRNLKDRPRKPFAIMAKDLETVKKFAYVGEVEERLLLSPARPIVLLRKRGDIFYDVSPGFHTIGVMLPYTGIHYLLLEDFFVLVMTSGNISGEMLCADNFEALTKLSKLSDGLLLHDRKIVNRCDDSVIKVLAGKPVFVRKSRGFIPEVIKIPLRNRKHPEILATGADLKSSFGFFREESFYGSQYLGDLSYYINQVQYQKMLKRFEKLFDLHARVVVTDLHPDYFSKTLGEEYAENRDCEIYSCQHHVAHIYSVMAEKALKKCIGVAFDGTGYGFDGKIWGGEFFSIDNSKCMRFAHLRYIPMPSGELAIEKPELMAYAYLIDSGVDLKDEKAHLLYENAPVKTSSAGRLFDAAAAVLDVCKENTFEGEAPMKLESVAKRHSESFSWVLDKSALPWQIDFRKMIRELYSEKDKNSISELASKFHRTLAEAISVVCGEIKKLTGEKNVCLSGGVFQNKLLLEVAVALLEKKGFNVWFNEKVSPNDEGIAFGQIYWHVIGSDG